MTRKQKKEVDEGEINRLIWTIIHKRKNKIDDDGIAKETMKSL